MLWGLFWAFLPLLGPWKHAEGFAQRYFYSAKLHMKIHFVAKFQENLMDGYPAISRTHGRTHARTDKTDNYSPFPTKVGGAKMNLWQKFFCKNHVKITKSQPPTMGGWAKQWKCDLQLIKMNFGAKKFFWKKKNFWKISKSLLRPRGPIWL